jgi:hypothetical protein
MAVMRSRPVVIAACGLLSVFIAVALSRDEETGRGWFTWLPGVARHSFAHSNCGIPIHFALGEVDPRFGFDRDTVMAALVEAANLWQPHAGTVLFLESDHRFAMTVSVQFDERQQAANTRRSLRGSIELDRRQLEADEAMLQHWSSRIEAARRAHERDAEELAHRVQQHEAEVQAWNANPARRTEAYRRALESESTALRAALAELERLGREMNADIEAYNRRAGDTRARADAFRSRVGRYNSASSEQPVESGRYSYSREQGRRIDVFRAESYDELVWVLAHEFGHALGIGHVEEPGAIMHALLHDGGELQPGLVRPIGVGEADRAALLAVCGARLR